VTTPALNCQASEAGALLIALAWQSAPLETNAPMLPLAQQTGRLQGMRSLAPAWPTSPQKEAASQLRTLADSITETPDHIWPFAPDPPELFLPSFYQTVRSDYEKDCNN
jgi:hypothetical protein